MSAADITNPNQFSAHWRNAETGEMEPVSDEVYAANKLAAKHKEQSDYADSVRTSDHLFNPDAPKRYW